MNVNGRVFDSAGYFTVQPLLKFNYKTGAIYTFQYIWDFHLESKFTLLRRIVVLNATTLCFLKYIVFTTPSEFKDFGINADFFFSNVNNSLFAVSIAGSFIYFTRRIDKQIQLLAMTGKILICLTLFFVPTEPRKLCPKSVPNPIRIKDPDDCTKYHLCVDMREFIITCPDHFVVSERSMKCVPEGSVFDTCE